MSVYVCVCMTVSVCVCVHTHLCVCARACLHVYGDGDTIRIAVEQEMWAMYYDQVFYDNYLLPNFS